MEVFFPGAGVEEDKDGEGVEEMGAEVGGGAEKETGTLGMAEEVRGREVMGAASVREGMEVGTVVTAVEVEAVVATVGVGVVVAVEEAAAAFLAAAEEPLLLDRLRFAGLEVS